MPDTPLDEARVIRGLIAETGVTKGELAAALGISTETLRRRLQAPGSWTVGSLDTIAPILRTTTETIVRRARGDL